MMAKKHKPSSPEQARAKLRAQAFEAVNLPADAAQLDRNSDIEITRAGQKRDAQKVKEDSARRLDAFAALKDGMVAGAYDAARRLQADLLTRRGEGDKGARTERVDCAGGRDLTDMIIAAGQACDWVKGRLSKRDWWLLQDLIQPAVDRGDWRAHVFHITGEANPHAQAAAVRAACANLRDAYEELDQAPQRRAA